MTRNLRHFRLPVPSTESVTDASLHLFGKSAVLKFDYFYEGEPRRSGIRFSGVAATQSRSERSCLPWHLKAYDVLVEVADSPWISRQREEISEMYRNEFNVRHFVIYFDSVGCFEFLAVDFEICQEEAGSWETTREL